jgi:hypothetical protein
MKNFFIIFIIGLCLSSCKKDWTCECNVSYYNNSNKIQHLLTNKTKSAAKEECDIKTQNGLNTLKLVGGGTYICELK